MTEVLLPEANEPYLGICIDDRGGIWRTYEKEVVPDRTRASNTEDIEDTQGVIDEACEHEARYEQVTEGPIRPERLAGALISRLVTEVGFVVPYDDLKAVTREILGPGIAESSIRSRTNVAELNRLVEPLDLKVAGVANLGACLLAEDEDCTSITMSNPNHPRVLRANAGLPDGIYHDLDKFIVDGVAIKHPYPQISLVRFLLSNLGERFGAIQLMVDVMGYDGQDAEKKRGQSAYAAVNSIKKWISELGPYEITVVNSSLIQLNDTSK